MGKQVGEDDDSNRPAFNTSREGIVLASIIIFVVMMLFYYLPQTNKIWEHGSNLRIYSLVLLVIYVVLIALGLFSVYNTYFIWMKMKIGKYDKFLGFLRNEDWVRANGVFILGSLFLLFVPVGTSLGILPGGHDYFGPAHITFLIIGVLICVLGVIWIAREGGYFSIWFIGAGFYSLVGLHGFLMLGSDTQLGPIDATLSFMALGILISSLLLYIYHELKFIYLSGLVDEALELNEQKDYRGSIKKLNEALKIYPNYTTALNNKGNVLYRIKDYEGAREHYIKAIESNPSYIKAKSNLRMANKKLRIKDTV